MASKEELENSLKQIKIDNPESNEECPVKATLEIIGGRWKLRILLQLLLKDVCRFNELKREVSGITNTMLSNSLHDARGRVNKKCGACLVTYRTTALAYK